MLLEVVGTASVKSRRKFEGIASLESAGREDQARTQMTARDGLMISFLYREGRDMACADELNKVVRARMPWSINRSFETYKGCARRLLTVSRWDDNVEQENLAGQVR